MLEFQHQRSVLSEEVSLHDREPGVCAADRHRHHHNDRLTVHRASRPVSANLPAVASGGPAALPVPEEAGREAGTEAG